MSAVRAYDMHAAQIFPERHAATPDIRVVRGRRQTAAPRPVELKGIGLAAAAVIAVIGVLCIVSVCFTLFTFTANIEADNLMTSIKQAKVEGSTLETEHAVLASSARIKKEAKSLGMAAPTEYEAIKLSEDIVKTDSSGNLSLSGSVDAAPSIGK